jgi:hypothetical protein
MPEPDRCDGCGEMTVTVHGRCPNCWHEKGPVVVRRTEPRQRSPAESLLDELIDLAWFFPGGALIVLAVLVLGSEVLLVIGLLLLLLGGAVKFGDFFP